MPSLAPLKHNYNDVYTRDKRSFVTSGVFKLLVPMHVTHLAEGKYFDL